MRPQTYFFYHSMSLTQSDFTYTGKSPYALFKILNNKLECISIFKSNRNVNVLANFTDAMETIQDTRGLGALLDVITFCAELVASCEIQGLIYESTPNLLKLYHAVDFDNFKTELLKGRAYPCSTQGNWPVVINNDERMTFGSEKHELSEYLLNELTKNKKISHVELSLLNYWKRGFVLGELWFWEECYLNFYKIIEYFLGKNDATKEDVEKLFKKVGIKADTTGVNETTKLLLELSGIRNNWDIAHVSIKKTQGPRKIVTRNETYSLSYHENLWGYRVSLMEFSRYVLCKHLGIRDLSLVEDGGLPALKKGVVPILVVPEK